MLALLSAAVPLADVFTSVLLALNKTGNSATIIQNPSPSQIRQSTSVHVLSFTSLGAMIVAESEGQFSISEWDKVYECAERLCCGIKDDLHAMRDEDDDDTSGGMLRFMKSTLQEKTTADLHWQT